MPGDSLSPQPGNRTLIILSVTPPLYNVLMVLGALTGAVDELTRLDPAVLADGESIVELHRQLNRLQAVISRAVGCFDASGEWQADRARSAPGWIMANCRLPKPTAKGEVALARTLRHLPATAQAWLAGDIALSHVRVLAAARRPRTEDQMAKDEAMLVGHATDMAFRHFAKVVDYWAQLADADGEDDKAQRQRDDDRRVHLSRSYRGGWFLDGVLDDIAGSLFSEELSRLEDELFKADWADAKGRLGHDPIATDLCRHPRPSAAPTP